MKFNTKNVATPLLLIASDTGDIKVAAYATEDGQRLVCNAGRDLYSPADGSKMVAASNKTEVMKASFVKKHLVPLGACTACSAQLVASATMADQIEVAGNGLHCPQCATEVTPNLDMNRMLACLASEYDEDDGDSFGDDADESFDDDGSEDESFDDDGSEDSFDDEDEDFDEDDADDEDFDEDGDGEEDSYDDDADDMSDDEDSFDDEDFDDEDDGFDDEDEDGEFASEDETLVDDAAAPVDGSDDGAALADGDSIDDGAALADGDSIDDGAVDADADGIDDTTDEAVDDGSDELASSRKIAARARRVAAVGKRKARRFKMKATAGEDVVDENGDPDDGEAEAIASKQLVAISKRLRKEGIQKRRAFRAHADDMADDVVDDAADADVDADANLDPATASARRRRRLRSHAADDGSRDTPTPGTEDQSGAPVAPGSRDDCPPGTDEEKRNDDRSDDGNGNDSAPKTTPGTEDVVAVAGDLTVDWSRAPIELVASAHGDNVYVVASGRPVGILEKANACETIQAQWKSPLLSTGFITVARTGLKAEAASEFGFRPISYTVQANDVMRNTIRRATETASQRAVDEARITAEKFKQSVKTAALGSVKGVFPDVKNPMRTALVASLSQLGVADAANVVDRAMASTVDAWAVGVFAKADELLNKPEAARNEVASYVATARFQVEKASDALSSSLAAGSVAAIPQQPVDMRATAGADKAPATQAERIRMGLASIQRR